MLGKHRISEIRKLHQKKFRLEQGLFLAEGAKIVPEMLKAGFPVQHLFATADWTQKHASLLENIAFESVDARDLEAISLLQTPQEVLAICPIPEPVLPQWKPGMQILVLDAIRDPGNLGTLMRLADWFGFDAIVASDDTVEWTNPKVVQASMVSFIRLRPVYTSLPAWFSGQAGMNVLATDLEGSNLYTHTYDPHGALILSNEAHGLSSNLKPFIHHTLHIPKGHASGIAAESLNVATAAAVVMGEFHRRLTFH